MTKTLHHQYSFLHPVLFILTVVSMVLPSGRAWGLPQFARKYNVACSECHAAVPRLNETGYEFRAAGFRMPSEIGKLEELKFENLNSFRIEVQAYVNNLKDSATDKFTTQSQVQFVEAAIHPMTGAIGTNASTESEFSFTPSGEVEVEQAHARYVFGDENSFGSVRGGVFHSFDGFGASDRPVGLSRPLIQTYHSFRGNTDTLFSPTDPSVAGLTAAYWFSNTNLALSLLNRPGTKVSDGEAEMSYQSQDSKQMNDLVFTATHIFGHQGAGSGVTFYYYHGQSVIPVNTDAFAAAGGGATYVNNFERFALYANYFLTGSISLIGGAGSGKDQLNNTGENLNSSGYFAGVEHFATDKPVASGLRYDEFKGDADNPDSKSTAVTVFVNWLPINQIRLVGEYQYLKNGKDVPRALEQNSLKAQIMFLY